MPKLAQKFTSIFVFLMVLKEIRFFEKISTDFIGGYSYVTPSGLVHL